MYGLSDDGHQKSLAVIQSCRNLVRHMQMDRQSPRLEKQKQKIQQVLMAFYQLDGANLIYQKNRARRQILCVR